MVETCRELKNAEASMDDLHGIFHERGDVLLRSLVVSCLGVAIPR